MTAAETDVQQSLDRTADQLFFIVGCGRSGTTLLQAMLSAHPDAVMPNETKFYTVITRKFGDGNDLGVPAVYDRALTFVLSWWWIADLKIDEARFRALASEGWGAGGGRCWEAIFLALLTAFGEKHSAERVGEKSPGHVQRIGRLADRFPKARFIHMVRDPRAVVLSLIRAKFATPLAGPKILKWQAAVDQHFKHAEKLGPSRYLLVRYEDLVRDQEACLRGVCRFLGLGFDEAMLRHDQREVRGFAERQMSHMANTLKPVFTSSIEKWRDELGAARIAMVEHQLSDRMRRLGYEPSGASALAPGARIAVSRAADVVVRAARRLRRAATPDED